MAVSFSSNTPHSRSASFPPKSNPMLHKIEVELKKLAKSEELCTSEMETISIGFSGLARLYKCVDEALKLRLTQQTLLGPLLDPSSKLLQLCTASNHMLSTLRLAVADVRTALLADSCGTSVSTYLGKRKEMMRSAKGVAFSLSQLELEAAGILGAESCNCNQPQHQHHHESEVSRVLTCVTIINISVLGSLSTFLMTKPAKQGLLHKLGLITKKKKKMKSCKAATLPARNGNKLSDVDAALVALSVSPKHCNADTLAVALKRLESMEVALSVLEDGLSTISTVLTKIRARLLKIVSS